MAKDYDTKLCVYKGPNAVRNYFDPEIVPPTPLVEIPDCLNPHRRDGVRIYAKMMTMHPANNVKAIPATNLLANSVKPGKTETVVEYSSGSTVLPMSLIARAIHGISDVRAFLSNKNSIPKIRLMQLFGIDVTLFGGPSQPEPCDQRGGIRAAQRMAQESESVTNPDQYGNDDNWKSHVKWTVPGIFSQLPEINLICAGMGTSGTMTGLGTYFKEAKPSVFRLGVCTAQGDRVPGPRSKALLAPVPFPWAEAVQVVEETGSYHAYKLSVDLTRQGLVYGPSSGFNLQGLFQFIEKRKAAGSLNELAGPDGEIHCVFIFCDLTYQYVDEYFDKLDETHFSKIKNEEFLGVDVYRYDEKWEREASDALGDFYSVDETTVDLVARRASRLSLVSGPELEGLVQPKTGTTVIDIRQASDYDQVHLPGSVNMPLVQRETPSPYFDTKVLKELWQRLETTFEQPDPKLEALIRGKRVLLVCYDGDSSCMAASVLRAKGCEADCIRGGLKLHVEAGDDMQMSVAGKDGKGLRQLVAAVPSHIAMPVGVP